MAACWGRPVFLSNVLEVSAGASGAVGRTAHSLIAPSLWPRELDTTQPWSRMACLSWHPRLSLQWLPDACGGSLPAPSLTSPVSGAPYNAQARLCPESRRVGHLLLRTVWRERPLSCALVFFLILVFCRPPIHSPEGLPHPSDHYSRAETICTP